VAVGEELLFCQVLAEVDVASRQQVYWSARAAFVRDPDELAPFEPVFARFWEGLDLSASQPIAEHGEGDPRMAAAEHGGESLPAFRREGRAGAPIDGAARARAEAELPQAAIGEGRGEHHGLLAAYSPEETLSRWERLDLDGSDLAAARRLAHELREVVPERRSRRLHPARRRGRLDVRGTLRRSLATDGEPFRPVYAARSSCPRRLLLLSDVSGSMESCSRASLAALSAAVAANVKAEAFVFATRLTRLTRPLTGHDLERALERARGAVIDWSGGTRIGQAFAEFNRVYGRLGLARGAIVIVVSDGWDRGEPQLLARELARLRLQCRRLVWVNPRPAELDGQPLAVGMRAALPYVDDFVAGHGPRAVARLAGLIGALSARPARRQRAVEPAAVSGANETGVRRVRRRWEAE
jgi:uncharacterized protein with von Willebrand factor type A (vWA) domain